MTPPSLGRTVLTYVLVGPPAGSVVVVAYAATVDALSGHPQSLSNIYHGMLLILAFGYVLGALPAIVTGLVMAMLAKRGLGRWQLIAASVPVGVIASLLCLFWILLGPQTGQPKESVIVMFSLVGATAAFVSSCVLYLKPRAGSAS